MQIVRFGVELDEGDEIPLEVGSAETGGSDKAFDIDAVNRMLTDSTQDEVEDKSPTKTETPAKGENTNQVDAGETEPLEKKGGMMTYFSGMLAALIVFALLVARDLGHLIGERVGGNYLTKSDKSRKADMYEEAEAIWANGAFVNAIDSFREYLRVFPGEYHVHKRIADIYEKDLAEKPNPNILGQGQTSNNHVSSYYGIEIYFLDHSFHKLSLESFVLFFDMNMLSSDLK